MEGGTLKCILEMNHHPLPNYRIFKKQRSCGPFRALLASGAAPLCPVPPLQGCRPLPGAALSFVPFAKPSSREDWVRGLGQPSCPSRQGGRRRGCRLKYTPPEKGKGECETSLPCSSENKSCSLRPFPLGFLLAGAKGITGASEVIENHLLSSLFLPRSVARPHPQLRSAGLGHALSVALLFGSGGLASEPGGQRWSLAALVHQPLPLELPKEMSGHRLYDDSIFFNASAAQPSAEPQFS